MFKILIVEDNAEYRKTLKALLRQQFPSAAINEAKDGKGAIRKLNDFSPDLIFMDIRLPGESGLELTKIIKGLYPGKTIIILTSHDLPEYRKAAIEAGADYFLSKGASKAEEIFELVGRISSGRKSKYAGRRWGANHNYV